MKITDSEKSTIDELFCCKSEELEEKIQQYGEKNVSLLLLKAYVYGKGYDMKADAIIRMKGPLFFNAFNRIREEKLNL